MILTCPACATSYFVDDAVLGQGRVVRCTSCRHSWKAAPEPELELRSTPEEGAIGAPIRTAADATSLGALPAEHLPRAFRAKAEEQRKVREAATAGVVWAGIGAAFAMVIITAMVFRMDIVRVMPRTAGAYAAVGLPVNQVGLTIEKVHAEPGLQDGRAALAVSGVIRNIRTKATEAPPLMIRMLDKDGHPVGGRTVRAGDALVPPGATRDFAVSLIDPPSAAKDVEVTFALDDWRPKHTATVARRDGAVRLREADHAVIVPAVAAAEAKPLSSNSPYALQATISQ
jgi:predicted Zn finger-like uncharacterized protein